MNQVAVEALYSATYVENYLDSVENLPDDAQKYFSRIRELDIQYRSESSIGHAILVIHNNITLVSPSRLPTRRRPVLRAVVELSDERAGECQCLEAIPCHGPHAAELAGRP